MMEALLMAGIGGFFGSGARYLAGMAAGKMFGSSFPAGTLAVNVTGSFLIGLFIGLRSLLLADAGWDAFLIPGFCGGFTTFSTFSLDSYRMFVARRWSRLLLYAVSSLTLCMLMVWAGMACGARFANHPIID